MRIQSALRMSNGLSIPQMGFGTYRLTPSEAEEVVPLAMMSGYRHFDCAKAYQNQKAVGVGLKRGMKAQCVSRERLFVTSKLWPTDQHPDHVRLACQKTIDELGVGYLDLFLIHWPICWRHTGSFETEEDKYPRSPNGGADVDTSVTLLDTWRAMSGLVKDGLVKNIGLCNCREGEVEGIAKAAMEEQATEMPVLNQIEYHPGCQDTELVKVHRSHEMLTVSHSPLGMPNRTTNSDFIPLVEEEILKSMSTLTGYSVPRLLLNWNLDLNHVVICKASKKEHIVSNAKAAQFALSDSVRLVLNSFHEKVRSCRVMNPTNFTAVPGKKFFPEPPPAKPTAPFGPYIGA